MTKERQRVVSPSRRLLPDPATMWALIIAVAYGPRCDARIACRAFVDKWEKRKGKK